MGYLTLLGTGGVPVASPVPMSNLKAWYKADAGVTLNGSTVSQWNDQSGNGNHLYQSTAANQPTFISDEGDGLPGIRFDGVNDILGIAGGANINIGNDVTFYIVWKKQPAAFVNWILYDGASTAQTAQNNANAWVGAGHVVASPMTADTWYVRHGTLKTTGGFEGKFYSNGSLVGTVSPGSTNWNLFRSIGSVDYGLVLGDIREILLYNEIHDSTEQADMVNYLNSLI